ncbi:MAG TPA: N-6 DNA methylase [Dysgonamonadaceae bacterium]|nr:N-6 DNA methylase [Dysgonamonadaceae bacterium]
MLDTQTKRRIDDCRDILVGKLPDPKAQIEQITIGLIYKFMDDMDKEAIELGGSTKFFSDDYEKYAWDKLFDTKVTATEMLRLYSEAIESMEKNPNIPQLFRDIFKNAYLPYRDPETLKLFLKTIGEFQYTHSEKLGDAFEYLLSIMGSQGDAGQFRTPRHIIDFLVSIVDPDIGETILDPACGTAGFLISAYKHILLKHTKANKEGLNIYEYNNLENKSFNNLGDQLTPDNRKKLIQNIAGYDISPDMVRLSLVNLYLHGFPDPEINEYDTLSSEERWNENFDVVLANPPFMSPKGGIRPHKKFTITSNRSEVLFVDYIAEHLNPKGKAGIIVPEGVIFQNGRAYKDLRKMLIENYLYAVVSLPAGVFNPYSGVKTSILLMDRTIARQRNDILFVKIDNDGYGLGAQRAAVKGSQLEEAIAQVSAFRKGEAGGHAEQSSHPELVSGSGCGMLKQVQHDYGTIAHAVSKSEIAANGDYNLSGERYKISDQQYNSAFFKKLGDVCDFKRGPFGGSLKKEIFVDEGIAVYEQSHAINNNFNDFRYFITEKKFEEMRGFEVKPNDILMSCSGTMGKVAILPQNTPKGIINQALLKLTPTKKILPEYLKFLMESESFQKALNKTAMGVAIKNVASVKVLKELQIPLPPLSIQEEIVAEIESYQKIIDSAKTIVENYKPRIDIDPDWEILRIQEIADVNPVSKNPASLFNDWFIYIDISSVENGSGIIDYSNKIKVVDAPSRARRIVNLNDILLSTVRPNLKAFGYVDKEPDRFIASTGFALLRTNDKCIPKFLYYQVFQDFMINQMIASMGKGSYPSINQKDVNNLEVAVPRIETQRQIVSQIEKEQELINANKQLIEIFEQKIKDRIAKVWGENKEQEESMGIAAEPQGGYVKAKY